MSFGRVSVATPAVAAATVGFIFGTHDLALLQLGRATSSVKLGWEAKPAYAGEKLVLFGVPGGYLAAPIGRRGRVVGTHETMTLTSPEGLHETLRDAISVAVSGIVKGDSGGPAIDAAGNVVGVIEGVGTGVATLTPAADLASLK